MSTATPVLVTSSVEFDEPLRTQPKGHAPADATSFIAQTLKTAGIDVPCSLYNEALNLAREGHLGQAHQRLQMLLCLDPDDADALLLTAKVNAAQGRPVDALAKLDAAVAAGIIAPAGFRDALEAGIRAERLRDEEARQKANTREKGEVGALRNEARHLRSETIRLEAEATDAREREKLWKLAAIGASAIGSVVILALVLTGAKPSESIELAPAAQDIVAEPVVPVDAGATGDAVAAVSGRSSAQAPGEPGVTPPTAAPVEVTPPKGAAAIGSPKIDVDEASSPRTHTVGSGDTLYKLAKRYYGDASKWERIRDANKDQLKGDIDLKLGMELRIP